MSLVTVVFPLPLSMLCSVNMTMHVSLTHNALLEICSFIFQQKWETEKHPSTLFYFHFKYPLCDPTASIQKRPLKTLNES